MNSAEKKLKAIAIAFLMYSVISFFIADNSPGQAVAQAMAAKRDAAVQCTNARAAGQGFMSLVAACSPEPLRHVNNWLLLGQIFLGIVLISYGGALKKT